MNSLELLHKLPIFAGLPEADLAAFAIHIRLDPFARETVIFYQGDPCDRVWLVPSGQVKIVYHDVDGPK